ncbi:hypothetical protein Tco_0789977 [Tanacetum coccineum]
MSTSNVHQQSLADAGSETKPLMLERDEDLRGDDLKHYKAEIEAMNLILISIPNDIYNSMDAYTTAKAMWQRVEHLMRGTVERNCTKPGDRVNIQSRNSGNDGRNTRRSYVEVIEGINVQNDAENIQRTLRTTSSGTAANVQCYNCSEKGVIPTDEQKYFLFVDASRIEEIKELSANICLMARIQPATLILMLGQAMILHFLVSNIIFDDPNDDVNNSSVEDDNNAQQSYE